MKFYSSIENFSDPKPLPHVEARVYGGNVLIRIHCVKCKGVLVKALEETEKLNLSVINSIFMPFGSSTVDITMVAQMDGEFVMAENDLETHLRSSLIQFGETSPP